MFMINVRNALATSAAVVVAGFLIGAVPAAAAPAKLTQAQAEAQFRSAGVTWTSSGGCTTRSNKKCTSFEQINKSTVAGVVALKKASACALTISGGTEVGHESGTRSHYNGYKVDILKASCVNSYIKNTFKRIADRNDGKNKVYPQWKSSAGDVYCDEGGHWDITFD